MIQITQRKWLLSQTIDMQNVRNATIIFSDLKKIFNSSGVHFPFNEIIRHKFMVKVKHLRTIFSLAFVIR